MKHFTWIFRHYFKRNVLDITNLLTIALPIIFAVAFQLMINFQMSYDDAGEAFINLNQLIILLAIGFQFFGASNTTGLLHADLKGAVRARLLVSGVDARVFSLAVVAASWVFNIIQGIVVIAFTTLVLDADWGNYGIALAALALIALMAQMFGIIIFKYTKDEKAGNKISYFFGEAMLGIVALPILVEAIAPIANYLPVGAATYMIESTSWLHMAILFGQLALVAVVAFFVKRGE